MPLAGSEIVGVVSHALVLFWPQDPELFWAMVEEINYISSLIRRRGAGCSRSAVAAERPKDRDLSRHHGHFFLKRERSI
jgi:hypothetical protein